MTSFYHKINKSNIDVHIFIMSYWCYYLLTENITKIYSVQYAFYCEFK